MTTRSLLLSIAILVCASCATTRAPHTPDTDLGLLWVKHAAEYKAIATQVYKQAELALPGFLADEHWSALPGQQDAEELPPAIIFDVDETVVSNVEFQLIFERPFDNWKLDKWSREHPAATIPGFKQFATAARAAGVELFFVTNRPCEEIAGIPDPCPQKTTTLHDIREAGIDTDLQHIMLSDEKEGWTREKLVRRELIAKTHRIIMLVGDDLSDFIPCVRSTPAVPCTDAATNASRSLLLYEHEARWGNGWYILPNPMHGSWTSSF